MPSTHRALTIALACAAFTSLATAQPPTDAPGEAEQADLLRGPAVTDARAPGASDSFADRPMTAGRDARPTDRPIPLPAFIHAVRSLDRQDANEELKLNEGQRAVIKVMLNEHVTAMKSWRENHRNEIQDLRDTAKRRHNQGAALDTRTPDDRGQKPGATDRPQEKGKHRHGKGRLDPDTRQEMKALMQSRPSAEAQRAQIWDILTPAQRDYVEAEIERRRANAANGSRRSKRLERPNGDDQSRPRSLDHRPAPLEGETPKQFEQRMLQRIEQLPEEQRERARQRLDQKIQRMNQRQSTTDDNSI